MATLLQILIQVMYVPGQGHLGVTPVCVIVVLHVETLLLFNVFFKYNFNLMTMFSELV